MAFASGWLAKISRPIFRQPDGSRYRMEMSSCNVCLQTIQPCLQGSSTWSLSVDVLFRAVLGYLEDVILFTCPKYKFFVAILSMTVACASRPSIVVSHLVESSYSKDFTKASHFKCEQSVLICCCSCPSPGNVHQI